MMSVKAKEESCSDVKQGIVPVAAAYPVVARGVFGPSPSEILEGTKGTVGQFYYLYLLVLYVCACFGLLPIPKDDVIRSFLIEYLGYDKNNWFEGALLLLACAKLALAIGLRVLLFPVGPDGRTDWRWNRWRK
mgnify:CR=1 FL=1